MIQTNPPHACWRCKLMPSLYGHLNRWYCVGCWLACPTVSQRGHGQS